MKRILLSISICLLAVSVMAQAPTKVSKVPTAKYQATVSSASLNGNEAVPTNIVPEQMRTPVWGAIGETYYDAVTNACSRPTVATWNDGTAAAVWTMATNNANRKTGYNYYNGTEWGEAPDPATGGVETQRTGWGVIAPLNDGEIVVSHDGASALVVAKRATKGTGAWTESTIVGPAVTSSTTGMTSTALLWPVITTVGDTIHIFACTESDTDYHFNGVSACLVYYRSCDGGNTWDTEARVLECLTTTDLENVSGDDYSIVARNGKIVLAVGGKFYDTYYCESNDGGNTWTKHMVYPFPGGSNFNFDTDFFGPCALNDNTMDVAIDDNGVVHVVFGTQRCERDAENEPGYYSYYSFSEHDGIIYWNSTMQPLPELDSVYLSTYQYRIGRPNLDGDDTIWYMGDISLPEYRSNGACTHPQIVAENGKVYVVWAAAMEAPFISTAFSTYYYGIFATVSEDNGQTWTVDGNTSWLSYNKDTYFIDWESTALYGEMFIEQETENFWPSVGPQTTDGNLAVQWYYDYTPGNTAGITSEATFVYGMMVPVDEIGEFCNTTEVYEGTWNWIGIEENTLSEMKVYPNPAENIVNVTVSSKENTNANVTITNLMGQVVYTQNMSLVAGNNAIQLDVANYNAGVYVVNVKTNTGISSQKVIVR